MRIDVVWQAKLASNFTKPKVVFAGLQAKVVTPGERSRIGKRSAATVGPPGGSGGFGKGDAMRGNRIAAVVGLVLVYLLGGSRATGATAAAILAPSER